MSAEFERFWLPIWVVLGHILSFRVFLFWFLIAHWHSVGFSMELWSVYRPFICALMECNGWENGMKAELGWYGRTGWEKMVDTIPLSRLAGS
jgi:hypothetical protein